MLGDIHNHRLLYAKAGLFVLLGGIASVLILIEHPEWSIAALLVVAIWSFCRAYYFLFYVLEHYVDPSMRYSGLFASLKARLMGKKSR